MKNKKTLKVKLVKSLIGRKKEHIACAKGLGLWRIGRVREVLHTPENLGMIKKIIYLLEVDKNELK